MLAPQPGPHPTCDTAAAQYSQLGAQGGESKLIPATERGKHPQLDNCMIASTMSLLFAFSAATAFAREHCTCDITSSMSFASMSVSSGSSSSASSMTGALSTAGLASAASAGE